MTQRINPTEYGMSPTMSQMDKDFERLAGLIEDALENSVPSHTLLDVHSKLCVGDAHMFPGKNAVVIAEIIEYPTHRAINIWLAAGDLDEIIEIIEGSVTAFGKAIDAYRQEFQGRRGWAKVAQAHGFKPKQTVFTRDLRN